MESDIERKTNLNTLSKKLMNCIYIHIITVTIIIQSSYDSYGSLTTHTYAIMTFFKEQRNIIDKQTSQIKHLSLKKPNTSSLFRDQSPLPREHQTILKPKLLAQNNTLFLTRVHQSDNNLMSFDYDSNPIVVDTGASRSITHDKSDFITYQEVNSLYKCQALPLDYLLKAQVQLNGMLLPLHV